MKVGANVTKRRDLNAVSTKVILVSRVQRLMQIADEVNRKAQRIAALRHGTRIVRSDSEKPRYRSDHTLTLWAIARRIEGRSIARQIDIVQRLRPVPRSIATDLIRPQTRRRQIIVAQKFDDRGTGLGRKTPRRECADDAVPILSPGETRGHNAHRCQPSTSNERRFVD